MTNILKKRKPKKNLSAVPDFKPIVAALENFLKDIKKKQTPKTKVEPRN
ncbi:hypothetical protein [Raoultella ornithinolytica]|nr:hypothetical protein [Raoultella ornithinolytica]